MISFLWFVTVSAQWQDWSLKFVDKNTETIECNLPPPVSVYSCYAKTRESINIGFNDKAYQWIGTISAILSASIEVDIIPDASYFLELRDIDTVADVYFNSHKIVSVENMFATERVDVTTEIHDGWNELNIIFQPPVLVAAHRADNSPMPQPPQCPPKVQTNGQCNVNMLRKAGYSFSWDWGPSMPDSGLYSVPKLYSVSESKLVESRVQLFSKFKAASTLVRLDVLIISDSKPYGALGLTFNPTNKDHKTISPQKVEIKNAEAAGEERFWKMSVDFNISGTTTGEDVHWWWPNGHGEANLYNATILWEGQGDNSPQVQNKLFGFRSVELVQDKMEDGGRSFYFKINDKPIFMSGSNWIPSSSSVADFDSFYRDNLESARKAGIKMLRVWGGGIYEREAFYEYADEFGIMIWQDFMFACSTYQNSSHFLNSVKTETDSQLWRIGSHPAIVVFAGNNENEAALATNWWAISDSDKPYYYEQYRDLYIKTIRAGILSANLSRPFVSSSPTNGIESEKEDWIAKNPYDVKYGDVHYYDYSSDCLNWRTFPKTRFASEFGYQSWGLISSVQKVTEVSDRKIGSDWFETRNHHGDGNKQMENFIENIFGEQEWMANKDEKSFEYFLYLSQIYQALCTGSQAAFYRSRAGVNGTMGALYWQLNDVWTTASWSSIDYSKRWKPLHYEIANIFNSPLSLLTNHDENDFLEIFVVSDSSEVFWVDLEIQTYLWNTLKMQDSTLTTHIQVGPNGSKLVQKSHIGFLLQELLCPFGQWDICFFNLIIRPAENETKHFDERSTWFSPVPFEDISALKTTDANVTVDSCSEDKTGLTFKIKTVFPQPFVWFETMFEGQFSNELVGHWNKNNILLIKEHTEVKWETSQEVTCEQFLKSFRIFYPSKVFSDKKVEVPKSSWVWWTSIFFVFLLSFTICFLLCDSRPSAEAKKAEKRPLYFGKAKPQIHKYA